MIIELKADELPIILDDYEFDVIGWIKITIGNESTEIHIKELMPALIAFDAKYSREQPDNE